MIRSAFILNIPKQLYLNSAFVNLYYGTINLCYKMLYKYLILIHCIEKLRLIPPFMNLLLKAKHKKFSWCVFRNWMFRMAIKLRGKRTYQIMEIYAYQIDWLFILQQDAITHHKINREKSRLLCIHLFLLPIRDDDVWWCSNTNANLYVKLMIENVYVPYGLYIKDS